DFGLHLLHEGVDIFTRLYTIKTEFAPSDPQGDEINPKLQQIDIALLPPHDLRVSVNPRS
ncbi:MAG: hypothetical protein KDA36_06660, partial [Planctomycetaceae bacterium]|nr:hypothetical protein [Planctomycetaceae bacterium]